MRAWALSIAGAFIAGLWLSYELSSARYLKLQQSLSKEALARYQQIEQEKSKYYEISQKNYAKYQEALNREPVIIDRPVRVLVKQECGSMPNDSSRGLGDGSSANRAELDDRVVQGIRAVTHEFEVKLESCQAVATSLQEKIEVHNNFVSNFNN